MVVLLAGERRVDVWEVTRSVATTNIDEVMSHSAVNARTGHEKGVGRSCLKRGVGPEGERGPFSVEVRFLDEGIDLLDQRFLGRRFEVVASMQQYLRIFCTVINQLCA